MSPDQIKVRVLFFGPLQDGAGVADAEFVIAGGATLADLIQRVQDEFPSVVRFGDSLRFAVNQKYAAGDESLSNGDVVAMLPPVSGGSGPAVYVELTDQPIDAAAVLAHVAGQEEMGAIVTFAGTSRSETCPEHGELLRLDYECYERMAVDELRRLTDTVTQRWPVGAVAIVHRIGSVGLAETSVFIAVACPHRADAFEACRWLIDTLKKDVPIWKKEVWSDQQATWVEPAQNR